MDKDKDKDKETEKEKLEKEKEKEKVKEEAPRQLPPSSVKTTMVDLDHLVGATMRGTVEDWKEWVVTNQATGKKQVDWGGKLREGTKKISEETEREVEKIVGLFEGGQDYWGANLADVDGEAYKERIKKYLTKPVSLVFDDFHMMSQGRSQRLG